MSQISVKKIECNKLPGLIVVLSSVKNSIGVNKPQGNKIFSHTI